MKYGRILPAHTSTATVGGKTFTNAVPAQVLEVITVADGLTLADMFHPDIAAQFTLVADNVEAGWVQQQDGSFAAPPPPPEPIPVTDTGAAQA